MSRSEAEVIAEAVAARLAREHDDRPLLSPATLAERLGLSQRTVRDMLAQGRIASFKVEGARRVDPAEVDRYLDEQRARSDA